LSEYLIKITFEARMHPNCFHLLAYTVHPCSIIWFPLLRFTRWICHADILMP